MTATSMKLILEDGTELVGRSISVGRTVVGEVVFATGMAGYVETLTDPSYRGQIVVLTYPLVGNYGVPAARDPSSVAAPYESSQVHVQGLVLQECVEQYSHHRAARSLTSWLREWEVPCIVDIDTRTLTRRLRSAGTMRGWMCPETMDGAHARRVAAGVDMKAEVFQLVTPRDTVRYPGGDTEILLIDVGAKDGIVRALLERGATVTRVPFHADIQPLLQNVAGIVIGNGPGDPKTLQSLIESIRGVLRQKLPVLGVCLGHQLLALAAGGDTYKLPYGHRGVNQPVQDLLSRRSFITSQNHGYAVRDDSLGAEWETTFINLNDGTNEGIRARHDPFVGVQFHPEACPGPLDGSVILDDFVTICRARTV